ncbi:hypothetical protein GEOBRER4_n1647 [Citrifermentans bremense]|uniref:Uncharacterized protein n=1 Tax=Citrifermentans bremense TaxID=60035 RepID=A0A7R7FSQ7_9BACT|nr:hypothetical protein GEOBRER4_n1647 [Citrifermentans bremense]
MYSSFLATVEGADLAPTSSKMAHCYPLTIVKSEPVEPFTVAKNELGNNTAKCRQA